MTAASVTSPIADAAPASDFARYVSVVLEAWTEALANIEANTPPPAMPPAGDLATVLEKVVSVLPAYIVVLQTHQGVLTGAAHLLDVLAQAGLPHADDLRTALLAIPGAMDKLELWLPRLLWLFGPAGPAPGIQGDNHRMGRG